MTKVRFMYANRCLGDMSGVVSLANKELWVFKGGRDYSAWGRGVKEGSDRNFSELLKL